VNPSIQVFDYELHRYYSGGSPAYGVVVSDTLPTGSQFVSASGDSGFSWRARQSVGGYAARSALVDGEGTTNAGDQR